MTRALVAGAALVVLGCSGATPQTCTPQARDALGVFYAAMASEVINAGACDAHPRVEDCPSYVALEVQYLAARKGICP